MNALQIKVFLFKNGLTVSAIARGLVDHYPANEESIRKMLTNMFYHGKFNAGLAALVEKKYGIRIDEPKRPQTVREAVRRAA
jgi:hypothetical protein